MFCNFRPEFPKLTFVLSICSVVILSQTSEACHQKCSYRKAKGIWEPYYKLQTSQFPKFEYLQSLKGQRDGAAELEEELRAAEFYNLVIRALTFAGTIAVDGASVAAGLSGVPGLSTAVARVGSIALEQLLKMKDIVEIKFKMSEESLKGHVRETVGTKAVNEMAAKLERLQVSVARLTSLTLSDPLKRQEVVPARSDSIEILHLFQNKEYVFWQESLFSAPFLLRFVLVWSTVVIESIRLEPSHRDIYENERWKIISALEEYRREVLARRPGKVVVGKDAASRSVCDHLYYSVKSACDKTDLQARKRPTTTMAYTTSCVQGVWDEDNYNFYKKYEVNCDSVLGCIIDSHSALSGKDRHPKLGTVDGPSKNDDYVYDIVTDTYFCADNNKQVSHCHWEYQQFLRDRINHDFNLHVALVRSIKIL